MKIPNETNRHAERSVKSVAKNRPLVIPTSVCKISMWKASNQL